MSNKKDCLSSQKLKSKLNITEKDFKYNIQDGQLYRESSGENIEIDPLEIRDKLEELYMDKEILKEEYIKLLKSTERTGIDKLINYLDENGFFESPCSGQYHLCEEGGLLLHSLNVWHEADKLYNVLSDSTFSSDSIILTSLLHDIGKIGQFGKPNYVPNMISDRKGGFIQSEKKPYETNKNLLPVPHEIRSIQIASIFIDLTEEENFAILHHNGMYGDLKYQLSGKERPLQMLLHFADMLASRVVEKGE
jgi:23S rRNA maturation-related 3'-5' exoribonuclease YhaM